MGLSVSAALCTVVLERHTGHTCLHGWNHISWSDPGSADWAGTPGPRQLACAGSYTVKILVGLARLLGVPAAMVPDRVCRGVPLHTVAGTNCLGVLRAAGRARRANPGNGRRRHDTVVLHRR